MDEAAPGACGPPGPGRHDYGSDGLGPAQAVLAAGHRGGDGVSLVLVGPGGHAIQAEGGQCLPAPGRAGPRASLSVPASPRGGREHLDDLGFAGGERREQIEPFADPGVVVVPAHLAFFGCPADAADRPGELAFVVASGLPIGRAGARTVDRHDVRLVLQDQAGDLVTTQMVTQVENPLIIDDRDVEALAFSAYIDTDPPRHKPSMPWASRCSGRQKPNRATNGLRPV
jgi:hypothetical protein